MDELLCRCAKVTTAEVVACIGSGVHSVEGIMQKTGVGLTCSSCMGDVERLLLHYVSLYKAQSKDQPVLPF